jgi:hypothetical protein
MVDDNDVDEAFGSFELQAELLLDGGPEAGLSVGVATRRR